MYGTREAARYQGPGTLLNGWKNMVYMTLNSWYVKYCYLSVLVVVSRRGRRHQSSEATDDGQSMRVDWSFHDIHRGVSVLLLGAE